MKKLSLVLAAVMLLACIFAACGSKAEDPGILGKWIGEEEGFEVIYVFEKDGKGYSETLGLDMAITYEINGDMIKITADATTTMEEMVGMTVQEMLDAELLDNPSSLISVREYTFELNGDTLLLDEIEYKRAN